MKIELFKLRMTFHILITTVVGFYLASPPEFSWVLLGWTLLGTGLLAMSAFGPKVMEQMKLAMYQAFTYVARPEDVESVDASPVRCFDEETSARMVAEIDRLRKDRDTVGGEPVQQPGVGPVAQRIVHGARNEEYGHPLDNHTATARLTDEDLDRLAEVIANELGVNLRQTSGPVLERPGDLVRMLVAAITALLAPFPRGTPSSRLVSGPAKAKARLRSSSSPTT